MLVRLLSTETKAKLILGAIGSGAAGWLLLPGGEPAESPLAAQVAQAETDEASPSALKRAKNDDDASAASDEPAKQGDRFDTSRWNAGESAAATDEPAERKSQDWPTDGQVTPVGGAAAAASDNAAPASSDPFAAPNYRNQPAAAGADGDAAADPFAAPDKSSAQDADRYGAPAGGAAGWGSPAETAVASDPTGADTVPPLKQLDQGTAPGTLPPLPPLEDEGYSASDLDPAEPPATATDENPLRSSRNGAANFAEPPAMDEASKGVAGSNDPFAAPNSLRASARGTSANDTGLNDDGEAAETNPFAAPSLPSASEAGVAEDATDAALPPEGSAVDPFARQPLASEPEEARGVSSEFAPPRGAALEEDAPPRSPAFAPSSRGALADEPPAAPAFTQPMVTPRTVDGTYVSRGGESLFDVARRELGSPARWVEIYELNQSQLGSTARRLPKGLRLQMPER